MLRITTNEREKFQAVITSACNDAIFSGLNFLKYEYLPMLADGDKRIFTKAQDVEILLLCTISAHSFLLSRETELNSLQLNQFDLTLELLDKIRSSRIYDDSPDLNLSSIHNEDLKRLLGSSDRTLQNFYKTEDQKVLGTFLLRMKDFMQEKNKYITGSKNGDFSFFPNMIFTSIFINPFIEKDTADMLLGTLVDDFSSSSIFRSTSDGYSLRLVHREYIQVIEQMEKKIFSSLMKNDNLNKILNLHMISRMR